jgi:hypothetical protein
MNAKDFRRIALSFERAAEGSHMRQADFRVAGRISATLASDDQGYGTLNAPLARGAQGIRRGIAGNFSCDRGRMGMTDIRLAAASEEVLHGALQVAWKLRVEKNAKTGNNKAVRSEAARKGKGRKSR